MRWSCRPRRRLFRAAPALRAAETLLKLTARERDVLRLAAEGLSSRQIATELFVGPTMVKTLVTRILRKLEAAERQSGPARQPPSGILP